LPQTLQLASIDECLKEIIICYPEYIPAKEELLQVKFGGGGKI